MISVLWILSTSKFSPKWSRISSIKDEFASAVRSSEDLEKNSVEGHFTNSLFSDTCYREEDKSLLINSVLRVFAFLQFWRCLPVAMSFLLELISIPCLTFIGKLGMSEGVCCCSRSVMNKTRLEAYGYSTAKGFTGHVGNYVESNTYWEMNL